MTHSFDFDFVDDDAGGRFVPVGGPASQLRSLVSRGDIDNAVRIYEETQGSARAELLEEARTASFDTKKAIGETFKRARDFAAAALCFEQARAEDLAAQCYEQAGDFLKAAQAWKRRNELSRAAACFQRAGKTAEALELYKQTGSKEGAAELLARSGQFIEAAKAYRAQQNLHGEVEVLRAGLSANPGHVGCAVRLAELMVAHGRAQQAAELLTESARHVPNASANPVLLTTLAHALDAAGATAQAQKVKAHLATLSPQARAQAPSPTEAPEAPLVVGSGADAQVVLAPKDNAYEFLKNLPLFADLALDDMKALYRVCGRQEFKPGQPLIEAGKPGKGLYVILEGQAQVVVGAPPKVINTLGAGKHAGEISLVQDGPTSATVVASQPTKVLFVSRDAFLQYLYNSPAAALCIWRLFALNLADRVRALSSAPK